MTDSTAQKWCLVVTYLVLISWPAFLPELNHVGARSEGDCPSEFTLRQRSWYNDTSQARSTPEALYSQLWASALPLGSMAAGDKCTCRAHIEPVTAEAKQGGHTGGGGLEARLYFWIKLGSQPQEEVWGAVCMHGEMRPGHCEQVSAGLLSGRQIKLALK